MRQELRKFEQYQKQFRLLHDEQINNVPELEAFIGKLSMQISELEEERSKTDNKRRRVKTDEEIKAYYAEIRGISAQIKPIRDKLKIAKATLETILTPIIARPLENDEYEIISGHRRLFASKRAGLTEVPTLVVEMDRDNAAIALVDSTIKCIRQFIMTKTIGRLCRTLRKRLLMKILGREFRN